MDKKHSSIRADLRYFVPPNFPRPQYPLTVKSGHSSTALIGDKDMHCLPGYSSCELFTRWDACEDLALELAERAKSAKGPVASVKLLDQYMCNLVDFGWISSAEIVWIVDRAVELASL